MVKSLEELVEEFVRHTQAQTREIMEGDARIGNKHAKAVLFTHPSMDVRTAAVAFLLRHRTAEAKAILEEAAKEQGLIPFEASEALKRWEEGTWSLDPAD